MKYGFRESDAAIQTRILATNSPIQSPTNTQPSMQSTSSNDTATTNSTSSTLEDGTQTTSDISDSEQSQTTIQPTATIEGNSLTKECAETALGAERFKAINDGQARPTLVELEKLKACFARNNYIIPSNFAPINPTEVANLPTSSIVKIREIKNDKKIVADNSKDVIKLSGSAAPNSTVIIYVFSEPLVLTTTSDDNGEWVYELENPIESGEHTMYAVVDRGDGVYEKTDPIKFAIGTAEASAENPAGLSLILNEEETAKGSFLTTGLYVASTIILLGAIALTAYFAYKKGKTSAAHNKLEPVVANSAELNADSPINQLPININNIDTAAVGTSINNTEMQSLPHQPGQVVAPHNITQENINPVVAKSVPDEEQQV